MRLAGALNALIAFEPLAAGKPGVEGSGPTFSVDVNVVNLYATVKGHHERLHGALDRDDLVLQEDGFGQEIGSFAGESHRSVPIGLSADTTSSRMALIPDERRAGQAFFS